MVEREIPHALPHRPTPRARASRQDHAANLRRRLHMEHTRGTLPRIPGARRLHQVHPPRRGGQGFESHHAPARGFLRGPQRQVARHRQLRRGPHTERRPQRRQRHRPRGARSACRRKSRPHPFRLLQPRLQRAQHPVPLLQAFEGQSLRQGRGRHGGRPHAAHAVGGRGRPQRPAHSPSSSLQSLLRLHPSRRPQGGPVETRRHQPVQRRWSHLARALQPRPRLRQLQRQDLGAAAHRRQLRHRLQPCGVPLALGALTQFRRFGIHHPVARQWRRDSSSPRRQLQKLRPSIHPRHPGRQRHTARQQPVGDLFQQQGRHVGEPHHRASAPPCHHSRRPLCSRSHPAKPHRLEPPHPPAVSGDARRRPSDAERRRPLRLCQGGARHPQHPRVGGGIRPHHRSGRPWRN